MTDVIAYLIGKTITMNQLKQEKEVDTRTEIFAQKEDISQSEFYKGKAPIRGRAAQGLSPAPGAPVMG